MAAKAAKYIISKNKQERRVLFFFLIFEAEQRGLLDNAG
jgi:hypothetical protein